MSSGPAWCSTPAPVLSPAWTDNGRRLNWSPASSNSSLLPQLSRLPEPAKYFLSTLPPNISRRALVNATKPRWRIERDYQDLKRELGLGHYEGRGWRGFHRHATLCIAAYGFLLRERGACPPSGQRGAVLIEEPAVPAGYRPRDSPNQA